MLAALAPDITYMPDSGNLTLTPATLPTQMAHPKGKCPWAKVIAL